MKFSMNRALLPLAVSVAIASPMAAHATNGMNMEGYGPIATGMGGASMAYDNGTAAMMNNPATLGLMAEDSSRLDLAVGRLGIDINASMPAMSGYSADSDATAFYMPALGYVKRNGNMSYGFGVFAQGGMGAEYAGDSFLAAGSGEKVRSEVGVGRAMVPLAMNVSDDLNIGGSLDFVWAMMDLKMAMGGAQFTDFLPPAYNPEATNAGGTASGTMIDSFAGMIGSGALNPDDPLNWARFDFSNSNDFTGQALGYGFAGKLGFTYKVADGVTIGASYHTKTKLNDMKTDDATVTMNVNMSDDMGGYNAATLPVRGKIAIKDFQWPATFGAGISVQATDDLMVAADVKRIQWSDVMADFSMTFTPDDGYGFDGTSMDVTMYQKWDDQTVYQLGAAYAMSDAFTLRVGANLSENPVPDAYLNPLFPATIENNYTAGFGLNLGEGSDINFSMTVTPEAKNTNPNGGGAGNPVTITHKQINWQLMYSASF